MKIQKNSKKSTRDPNLFLEIKEIIQNAKEKVARTINATLTATYWYIGKRINDEVLENKRAGYGKEIVKTLSAELTKEYGRGWSEKQLRHCLRFAETFADFEIVSARHKISPMGYYKTQ